MRMTGIVAVLTAVLIGLAGCQTNQSKPANAGLSPKNKALFESIGEADVWPEFERRAQKVGTEMGRYLVDYCMARGDAEPLRDCFHRQMLVAFDVHGAVAEHCPPDDDMDLEFQCIGLSAISYSMAKRAGGNALADFDWSDLEGSAVAASFQIVAMQVDECLSTGAASDPRDCVMAGVIEALGLTKEHLTPCDAIDDDKRMAECVGQAYGYKELVDALARLRERDA
jgi:hypothetical protein